MELRRSGLAEGPAGAQPLSQLEGSGKVGRGAVGAGRLQGRGIRLCSHQDGKGEQGSDSVTSSTVELPWELDLHDPCRTGVIGLLPIAPREGTPPGSGEGGPPQGAVCRVLASRDDCKGGRAVLTLHCLTTFWDQWHSAGALWFWPGISGFLIKQNLFLVTHDASAKHRTDLCPLDLRMHCLCYSINN